MKCLLVGAVFLAVGCGGSGDGRVGTTPATGPLKLAIVSGDNQIAIAGADSLPAPVVGKLIRLPDGTVSWIKAVPSRALDLFVPRAFAQTSVTGSPIAGALVCAVSVDPLHKLIPFTPCTNTDVNGQATFFFSPDTLAGVATAEIRGTLNNQPAVFDTVSATIKAGALNSILWKSLMLYAGRPTKLGDYFVRAADKYGNPIVPDELTVAAASGVTIAHDTITASLPERALTLSPSIGGPLATYVVPDFRGTHFKIVSMCVFPGGLHNQQNVPIDSQSVDGVVDSATYSPNNAAQSSGGVLWFTATVKNYLHPGSTESVSATTIPFQFFGQRPDTLFINSRPGAYQNDGMIETSSSPLTYQSTTHCWQGVEPYTGHITLSAQ